MNKQLQDFARKTLKEGLAQCTKDQQKMFKQIHTGSPGMNYGIDINMVVDEIGMDKLDWAMQQVQETLDGNEKEKKDDTH